MRKLYLDNIRWITIVLVVIYHVIYMYNGIETAGVIGPLGDKVQYQDAFQYIVYPWFMLLLFVIAGMCSRYYLEKHTHKEFIKSRTVKLLVPSTIGLFVFQWILGYYNMMIGGALEQMDMVPKPILYLIMSVSGTGPLWFIQLLWLYSIMLVVIRKIEKDRFYNLCSKSNIIILLLLTIVIWGAAQVLNTPIIVVYRFGIYGVSFLIGYFVLSHDSVIEKIKRIWILLGIAALVLAIGFVICYWQESYAEHIVLDTPLCNVYAWIATLAIIAFMSKYGNIDHPMCRFMNKQSWGLYIFHYLPLAACAWYLRDFTKDMPVLIVYLLTALSAFIGAYILNAVISRVPLLKWCVLGIKTDREMRSYVL